MQELTEAEVHFLDAVLVHHPGRVGCPAEGIDWIQETASRLVEDGWVTREEITREDEDWIAYRFLGEDGRRVQGPRGRKARASLAGGGGELMGVTLQLGERWL